MFFYENPEASRRLANAMHIASELSLFEDSQIVEAAIASQRATSWETLPKWLRDIVALVEGAELGEDQETPPAVAEGAP